MNTKQMMAGVIALATVGMSYGAVIQFDFGGGATYTGADAPAGVSGTTWNGTDGRTDIASGLLNSDGTAATGISLDIGSGGGDIVDWTGNAQGNSANAGGTGVYATDLMNDWVYTANDDNYGARILGLAAGQYDVYALVREPNELTRTYDVGIGVGETDDITALTITSIGDATGVDTWTAGLNYAKTTVTVTAPTDYVTVIVDPTNADWATLEGLQIVAIPEPATFGLLAVFGGGLMFFRRRFKR